MELLNRREKIVVAFCDMKIWSSQKSDEWGMWGFRQFEVSDFGLVLYL